MHVKSCAKLVRSELRLDLGQQQGALLRRSQSNRLPLAALSTNTLRCGPQGGAIHGGGARAKGAENCGFTEEESALDVWSVIRPGHVREKIALFAHDHDRNVKGSWDVTAKRRRRTGQIQPLPQAPAATVTVTLQATPLSSPAPPDHDDPKLSVVEMVAFLEQRVTCSPHAKLRSSASITLSRAPPPPTLNPAPSHAIIAPSDRPVIAVAEESESLSVSDMVAKLESQCLRRRGQGERRAVGRVLLAEQPPALLPPSQLKSPPPRLSSSPSPLETRKSSVLSVRKPDVKVRARLSIETKDRKTVATPTSLECSNDIGRQRTEAPPSSQTTESKSEMVLLCKSEKTKTTAMQKCASGEQKCDSTEVQETAVNSAAILSLSVCAEIAAETRLSPEVAPAECVQAETVEESVNAPKPSPQNSPLSSSKSTNSLPLHEEPLPGLLFLTPPPKPCVQSEQRNSPCATDFAASENISKNRDSLVVLSLDLTVQSRVRTRRSPSPSPVPSSSQSEKRKRPPSDIGVQSEESELRESERTLTAIESTPDQSQNATISIIQSEARIELLMPAESQSQRRRLNRIGQSEKRKSCPVSVPTADSLERLSSDASDCSQSEMGLGQWEGRVGGAVLLRSASDVSEDRRRRRKAARAFSLCSADGAGRAASEDFLLMRRRVQSLLEPRTQMPFLSLLPHHLLVQILLLLPTRALAALKCSCRYLRLVVDTYDPRPLDALWVCDPRYRDDPCKQCKRRRRRGDVSLCRWHHKPFCQAMPYGPGYWMCCHGDRREAPGCNVGLHDNRWVPAFHSISAATHRQRAREEEPQ